MRRPSTARRTASGSEVRGWTRRAWSAKENTATSLPAGRLVRTPRTSSRMGGSSDRGMLPEVSKTRATRAGRSLATAGAISRPARTRLPPHPAMVDVAGRNISFLVKGLATPPFPESALGKVWPPRYNQSLASHGRSSQSSDPAHAHRWPRMPRPKFRNNAPLVLLLTAGALALFLTIEVLLRKSRDFSPDFLASVLLYGLTVLNLTLLLILIFVLGRNLVRVVLDRRRGVLGARFRMRLLLVFLLMAIAPSLLLIVVGSDLIQQAVDRWFNVDVERILSSSQALATALRESVTDRARVDARALAREFEARGLLETAGQGRLRRTVEVRSRELQMDLVNVFSREGELVAVMDPRLPPPASYDTASGEALAEAALSGREAEAVVPFGAGELMRVAVPVRDARRRVTGAVLVSSYLPGGVAAESREVQERYTKFKKAETFKGPIKAVYLSLYLFPALLILFGAVWLSLYLARRITTPLHLVAEGAERIAAGERGVRVDFPSSDDEFAALIASFNRMSERLARSEEEVEH